MTLNDSKRAELLRKLDSVRLEFEWWREDADAEGTLPRHHTQVHRLTDQLASLRDAIGRRLKASPGTSVLADALALERRILEVHEIWGFFRAKLALRKVDFFRDYLATADDFAWACYSPAVTRFAKVSTAKALRLKGPPLVFFDEDSSPYELSRERSYENWLSAIPSAAAAKVVRKLPIPLVGIPWYQVSHVPDALIIGHEVGHAVEDDLGLTGTLERNLNAELAALPAGRRAAWLAWTGEVFADVYGCLATGPAYVSALMHFLVESPRRLKAEVPPQVPPFGDYPPVALRVCLNLATLEKIGFAERAADLRRTWSASFPSDGLRDWQHDVRAVVDAMLDRPYAQFGGAKLTDVITFAAHQQEAAEKTKALLLKPRHELAETDVRVLVAAARIAFDENSDVFHAEDAGKRLIQHVSALNATTVRNRPRKKESTVGSPEDSTAGDELLAILDAS